MFAFAAPFVGSIPGVLSPGTSLNQPIIAIEAYGDGYLLLGTDGGVFNFSDRDFAGSLGSNPPSSPVIAVQPVPPAAAHKPPSQAPLLGQPAIDAEPTFDRQPRALGTSPERRAGQVLARHSQLGNAIRPTDHRAGHPRPVAADGRC